jgi:hypothetical protein
MKFPVLQQARKAALNLLLLLVASVVALVLGEIAVRLVAPQQLILLRPDLWQPVDSVGWAHRPNLKTQVNTGDRTVWMYTDSSGFRVGAAGRQPGRYRILLLGDSFMAAMQVEYEESLPGLIDRCFATRTGQTAAVWNSAVAGWDPPQYYVEAGRALNAKPFDLVLVAVFLGNDIVDRRRIFKPREPDPRHNLRFPRHLTRAEFVDALLAPINDGLETRSHLFVFFKNRFQTLLMRFGLTGFELPTELRRDQASSPRWSVTADILADIDSLAKAHGVPTAFALIPAIEQVEPAVLQDRTRSFGIDPASLDMDQPERLMIQELDRRKLTYVSLLPVLRQAHSRGITLYGQVDKHPSVDGHRVMWDGVAPLLAQRLRLPYHAAPDAGPPCGPP